MKHFTSFVLILLITLLLVGTLTAAEKQKITKIQPIGKLNEANYKLNISTKQLYSCFLKFVDEESETAFVSQDFCKQERENADKVEAIGGSSE